MKTLTCVSRLARRNFGIGLLKWYLLVTWPVLSDQKKCPHSTLMCIVHVPNIWHKNQTYTVASVPTVTGSVDRPQVIVSWNSVDQIWNIFSIPGMVFKKKKLESNQRHIWTLREVTTINCLVSSKLQYTLTKQIKKVCMLVQNPTKILESNQRHIWTLRDVPTIHCLMSSKLQYSTP